MFARRATAAGFGYPRAMFLRPAVAGLLALALAASPASADPHQDRPPPQGVHAFVAAYPAFLDRVENGMLVWQDGTRMPLARLGLDRAGRPVHGRNQAPSPDPRQAATEAISAVDYEPIFLKMYGDCRTGPVAAGLKTVRWNRGSPEGGIEVRAAAANGVAEAMQRVSDEIDRMPGGGAQHRSLGGTYNCRTIAKTSRLSLHGFGIAIDVNPTEDGYWQTAPVDTRGEPIRKNRIPMPVIEAFERHGFVWGGRWNQFDTFHFEYRPEYRIAAGGRLPDRLTRESFRGFFGGRMRSAVVERMSYAPKGPGAVVCHRWVRQPGPSFGRCLSATMPLGKAKAPPPARKRGR